MFVIGHKSPNRREIGTVLYYGNDADAANKAHADNAKKFPRIDISLPGIEAFFRTVQHYEPDHPVAKAETEKQAAADKANTKAEEAAADKTGAEETAPETKPKKSKK